MEDNYNPYKMNQLEADRYSKLFVNLCHRIFKLTFYFKRALLPHSLGYFFGFHYFNLLECLTKLDTVKRNSNLLLPHICSIETSKGLHLF